MNLDQTITLRSGGVGSGCNPEVTKCGRPAGAGKELYHGTIVENLEAIMKDGIKPWREGGRVFATEDREAALRWGSLHGSEVVALFHLDAGKTELAQTTERSINHWVSNKTISPDAFLRIELYKVGQTKPFKTFAPKMKAAASPSEMYVAIVGLESKEIKAGGPGSGCHGPNCGRPHSHIEEGDRAILLKPHKGWDTRNYNRRTFPMGTEVKVVKIDHSVAGEVPIAHVYIGYGKGKYQKETEQVSMDDLQLLKKHPDNRPEIKVKPVTKSKIISRSKTSDGAHYTIVKPSKEKDDDRGKFKPHGMKGKFKDFTGQVKVLMEPNVRSQVFFAKVGDTPNQGTTVFVYRNYEKNWTTVREINSGAYGHVFRMSKTWEYRNHGAASNFLSRRYGIKQKLPKGIRASRIKKVSK